MIKETKQQQEVIIKKKYCDICETEIERGLACSAAKCEICGRDLCEDCIGWEKNTSGDYREVYCKSCWNEGEYHRVEIRKFEKWIEVAHENWIIQAKEAIQRKKLNERFKDRKVPLDNPDDTLMPAMREEE